MTWEMARALPPGAQMRKKGRPVIPSALIWHRGLPVTKSFSLAIRRAGLAAAA
jgi:hypothetical protein